MYTVITDSIIDSCSTLLCTINWLLYLLLWVFTPLAFLQNFTGVPFATGTFFFCRDMFMFALSLFSALYTPTVVSQPISACVPDCVANPDLFSGPGCSLFAGCDGRMHHSFLIMKDEVVLPAAEEVGFTATVPVMEDNAVDNVGEIQCVTQPIVLAEDSFESEAVEITTPVKSFLDELIEKCNSTMERGVSLGVSSGGISLLSSRSLPSIVAVADNNDLLPSDVLFDKAFTFDEDTCFHSADDLVSEVVGNDDVSLLPCLSDEDTEMLSCPSSVSKTAGKYHSFFGGRCTPTQSRPMGAEDSYQAASNMSLCESEFYLGSAEDMDLDRSAFTSSTAVKYSSQGIDESYAFFGIDSTVEASTASDDATGRFSLFSRVDSLFESTAEMEISDDEVDEFAFFNRISEFMDTTGIEDELEEGTDGGASLFGGSEAATPLNMVASAPAVKYTRASIFDDDDDDDDDEDDD